MEMHQIRYFLAVCDTLNFTRAAERCNVAQPSLTKAIRKLEEELGGELFRRERNLTHLTDLGRLMRPFLEQTYTTAQAAKEEAASFGRLEKAPLNLGIMCTIGPSRIIGLMNELSEKVPNLDVHLHEGPGQHLVGSMMKGELDVALIGLPQFPDRLDTVPLYRERYVVAFPPGHRFEALPAVPMKEMSGEDYLQRINCEFPDHFADLGIMEPYDGVNVRYRSEREEWIQAMIMAGMGCAFMPEHMPLFPGLKTRVVTEPEVFREIKLVTVAGRRFPPAVAAFVRLAKAYDWHAIH